MTFGANLRRTAIVVQARQSYVRCLCPECLTLDTRYPGEGYQLALVPYRLTAPLVPRRTVR